MTSVSELARLYEATFGAPPSSASTAALLRMEKMLGLAQDDPLARMLIVQLRVADQINESHRRRSRDEEEYVARIRELTRELTALTATVSGVQIEVVRRHRGIGRDGSELPSVIVDTYRRASPLWSYLGEALRSRTGALDADERIWAARLDLLFVSGVALVILLGGMALKHVFG